MASSLANPNLVLYLNVGSLVDAARRLSNSSVPPAVETQALGAVAPIQAITLTSVNQSDGLLERVFLVVN
jgi:hypothetical protein